MPTVYERGTEWGLTPDSVIHDLDRRLVGLQEAVLDLLLSEQGSPQARTNLYNALIESHTERRFIWQKKGKP